MTKHAVGAPGDPGAILGPILETGDADALLSLDSRLQSETDTASVGTPEDRQRAGALLSAWYSAIAWDHADEWQAQHMPELLPLLLGLELPSAVGGPVLSGQALDTTARSILGFPKSRRRAS